MAGVALTIAHRTKQVQKSTATDNSACTTACTSEATTNQTDRVAVLAAALLNLSAEDRARLPALLLETPTMQGDANAP
jgi:hypothetical protein